MRRRRVLATAGTVLATAASGCLGGSGGWASSPTDRADPVETPPEGDCERSSRLRPTPASPRAKPYPDHPDPLTAATARTFAAGFERSYRYNARLPEYGTVAVSATAPEWAVSEREAGYAVGVEGRVSFGDGEGSGRASRTTAASNGSSGRTPTTPTPLPSGTRDFAVWYFLADRFALRGDPVEELQRRDRPALSGAEAVACARSTVGGSGRVGPRRTR